MKDKTFLGVAALGTAAYLYFKKSDSAPRSASPSGSVGKKITFESPTIAEAAGSSNPTQKQINEKKRQIEKHIKTYSSGEEARRNASVKIVRSVTNKSKGYVSNYDARGNLINRVKIGAWKRGSGSVWGTLEGRITHVGNRKNVSSRISRMRAARDRSRRHYSRHSRR